MERRSEGGLDLPSISTKIISSLQPQLGQAYTHTTRQWVNQNHLPLPPGLSLVTPFGSSLWRVQ